MNLGWYFKPLHFGDVHAGALLHPLDGAALPPEHLLAREAIQNSVDARSGNKPVKVCFRRESADDDRLNLIGDLLGLLDEGGPIDRKDKDANLGLGKDDFFDAQLDPSAYHQSVLYIEDYGTEGLGGPPTSSAWGDLNSRYYRLVVGSGVPDDSDELRGGSFGFGKSVYWSSSNVRTVAFYSVFEPSEATDGNHARFIVAGLYDTHDFENCTFSGRAWFGDLSSDVPCVPLADEDAHQMASRLGFKVRSPEDLGTSILILGSELAVGGIRDGVENHWWPRIVEGGLVVELVDNGSVLLPPNPQEKKELKPYIKAYKLALDQVRIEEEHAVVRQTSKYEGRAVGWCAVIPADRDSFPEDEEHPHHLKPMYPNINEVALIRAPRMVVAYYELRHGPDVVGAFVADDQIDPVLKLSEPPDHTRWSGDSPRLSSNDKAFVRNFNQRIDRVANALRSKLRGDDSETVGNPRPLEELMGRLFAARKGGVNPPPLPPPSSNVTVKTDSWVESQKPGLARLRGKVQVRCSDSYDGPDFRCRVSVGVEVLKHDTRRVDEALKVVVADSAINLEKDIPVDDRHTSSVPIGTAKDAVFHFASEEYDDYALCQVVVETEEV